MRTPWSGSGRPAAPPDPIDLLQAAVQLARRPGGTAGGLDPFTAALADRSPDLALPGLDDLVDATVRGAYDRGWQPADLVHVAARRVSRRAARLVGAVVLAEAVRSRAADRAPQTWVDQLAALPEPAAGPASGSAGWWAGAGVDAATGWRDLVRVLALLPGLPPLEQLLPRPSSWPQHRDTSPAGGAASRSATVRSAAGPVEEKVLGRVRGLLAKAERTEFPEEADALTAKAQELMSRYAIDHAVLVDHALGDQGVADLAAGVQARRLHLTDPFSGAKAALLHAVAAANGCQVVLLRDLGIATAVGSPVDLELVELLFTSLLLQATRALAADTRAIDALALDTVGAEPASAVFKRAFLLAYASRIGERLAAAGERAAAHAESDLAAAHGRSVLPVLARREAAVTERVAELFPRLRKARRSTVDPEGWWAGRRAADAADLGGGRTRLGRP